MNRLLDIGFEPAGHWLLNDSKVVFEISRYATQRNILYAFISDGEVKYVGKTIQRLYSRMASYKNPGSTQSTNIRNHERIKTLLQSGAAVEILALPDNGLFHYGPFHFNLAAGLEDNIIRVIDPEWNGGKRDVESATASDDTNEPPASAGSFALTLQPTYFRTGFFNIGVSDADRVGGDGQKIEIFCGNEEKPILGVINRRANTNNTPRIMGGAGLRDWFQKNLSVKQTITIAVLSPTAIRVGAGTG
ncbi:MAG: GIY-YIG nuclease family protein [Burkholderiales bacterium]|nr:GIY-YIG nuclease family protein [Burkholderiales bacterium]